MADEAFAQAEGGGELSALLVAVAGLELQDPFGAIGRAGDRVEDAVLGRYQGGQLGEDHVRDVRQVVLALEHAGDAFPVRLQPVLLDVLPGGLAQVADHLVQGVLERGDLAARLHPDLTGEVAVGHGGGHVGDGPDLVGQVGGQLVHVVGQVLPDATDLGRLGLAAQLAFDPHLACHPGDLSGEGVQLVHHGVDGVLELEELALDVDGDLLGQIAVGHGGRHLGDVADLSGQVAGHEVDVVGQVLPDAADLDGDGGGLAELALGADLACHPCHFGDEAVQLVHHGVDGVLELQHLAGDLDRHLLGQVAVGHGPDDALHLGGGSDEGLDQVVDRFDAAGPARCRTPEHGALGEPTLGPHYLADTGQLLLEGLVGDDDVVETVGHLAGHARPVEWHAGGEVPPFDPGEDSQHNGGIERVGLRDRGVRHEASRFET